MKAHSGLDPHLTRQVAHQPLRRWLVLPMVLAVTSVGCVAAPPAETAGSPAQRQSLTDTAPSAPMGDAVAGRQTGQILVAESDQLGLGEIHYLMYLPAMYGAVDEQRWPMIVFLHGSDERGSSARALERVRQVGLPNHIDASDGTFPLIAVSPLAKPDQTWVESIAAVEALISSVMEQYSVDPRRIYLTGLSMGGFGVWELAVSDPERYAALVPISGGSRVPDSLCTVAELPAWVFHGQLDDVVPVDESRAVVRELEACGGSPTYTEYPEARHDAWTQTYANPSLYDWLLDQVRTD